MRIKNWEDYSKWMGIGYTAFPKEVLFRYSGQKILDIGCGIGKHLEHLGNRDLKVGIEVTDDWVKKGRLLYKDILFIVASAYELPFKDRAFDTLIMIDVIEHLHHPKDALKEMKRVLMNNGILILQTPNYPIKHLYDIKNWLRTEWKQDWKDDPTHVSKFSFYSIEKLVRNYFSLFESYTRNIIGESCFFYSHSFKRSTIGKLVGHKTIIIAQK